MKIEGKHLYTFDILNMETGETLPVEMPVTTNSCPVCKGEVKTGSSYGYSSVPQENWDYAFGNTTQHSEMIN